MAEKLPKNTTEEALTSIRSAYTLAATPEGGEVEELMVRHFLNTMAEVALSIALRKGLNKEAYLVNEVTKPN